MVVPKEVKSMLGKGKIIAFATTDKDGMPNVVPILQHWWLGNDVMVIGDLLLKASRGNVLDNRRVCISAWDEESGEGYKLKGKAHYEIAGSEYVFVKSEILKTEPDAPKGVVIIRFTEVYDISLLPNAGKLIIGEES